MTTITLAFAFVLCGDEPSNPIVDRYVVSCLSAAKTRLKEVEKELKEALAEGKPKKQVKSTIVGSKEQLKVKRRSKESIEKIRALKEERDRLRRPNALHHRVIIDEHGKSSTTLKPEAIGVADPDTEFVLLQVTDKNELIVQVKGQKASSPGPTFGILGYLKGKSDIGASIEIPVPLMVVERKPIEKSSSKDREIWWLRNIETEIAESLKRHAEKTRASSK